MNAGVWDPRSHPGVLSWTLMMMLMVVVGCGVSAPPETSFQPPVLDRDAGVYLDAQMVDAEAARGLNPEPSSPEAAVTRFLASRVRGDGAWREAMSSPLTGRAERGLEEWNDWTLRRFQLRRRSDDGDGYWVTVFFEIEIDGGRDQGEDEFSVVPGDGGWRIASVPS